MSRTISILLTGYFLAAVLRSQKHSLLNGRRRRARPIDTHRKKQNQADLADLKESTRSFWWPK